MKQQQRIVRQLKLRANIRSKTDLVDIMLGPQKIFKLQWNKWFCILVLVYIDLVQDSLRRCEHHRCPLCFCCDEYVPLFFYIGLAIERFSLSEGPSNLHNNLHYHFVSTSVEQMVLYPSFCIY